MTGTVKICSLRRPEDGIVASEAGADFAGLIFAQARRQVSVEQAAEIVAAVRSRPGNTTRLVGVFVNDDPARINAIAERLELDYVQLNGHEPAAQFVAIERPVIKALRLPAGTTYDDARVIAERFLDALDPVTALLLDAHVAGAFGGTGQTSDWTLAARLAAEYPVILAGGLNPGNVGDAIDAVRPLGVDVSSGVETNGLKDHARIHTFVEAAREAFDGVPLTLNPLSQRTGRGGLMRSPYRHRSYANKANQAVYIEAPLPESGEGIWGEGLHNSESRNP
ncbi:MAG TPA: phosphoribosylanthranilate isomerase [Thermomicrobiaceae bacterium]|nr:phosphoribosylanthranilate isomerase [Thermomicrobiaceae bacterium]